MTEFKKLTWGPGDRLKIPNLCFSDVLDPQPFSQISICKDSREVEKYGCNWQIRFEEDGEWGEEWITMELHDSYSLEEIHDIVQAAWEYYITTSFFVSLS